jgi:hypothetical protein
MQGPHAEIVKRRWGRYLAAYIAEDAKASKFIPPGSDLDPRAYLTGGTLRRSQLLVEKVANAAGLASRVDAAAQTSWNRDLRGWLYGKQSATPQKIRVICRWLGHSWIVGLRDAGYFQHLIHLIHELATSGDQEGALAVSLTFDGAWLGKRSKAQTRLDVWIYLQDALPRLEAKMTAWSEQVPASVKLPARAHYAMRGAFRLCDGEDARGQPAAVLDKIAFAWPQAAIRKRAAELIGIALKETLGMNPFSGDVLRTLAAASYTNVPPSSEGKREIRT